MSLTSGKTMIRFTCKSTDQYIRNAQAAEIFRSSFYKLKNSDSAIPTEDLDQLVVMEKSRPSALIGLTEFTGSCLGLVSRYIPAPVGTIVQQAVDEATIQQFNDSIRSMQENQVDNVDIKETLKFHRDLSIMEDVEPVENTYSSKTARTYAGRAKTLLSTTLYHALKVTDKV